MRLHLLIGWQSTRLRATITETAHGLVQWSRSTMVQHRKEAVTMAATRAKRRGLSTYDVEDQSFRASGGRHRFTIAVE
jgi:hypothetical protein